jgi:basic membrane protein A
VGHYLPEEEEMRTAVKLFAVGLLVVTVLAVSCASPTPAPSPTSAPTPAPTPTTAEPAPAESEALAYLKGKAVAVVFAPSGLGDKSLNDSLFAGMVLITNKYDMKWNYVEPLDFAQEETILRDYARTGDYALIVCNGLSCGTSMEAAAKDFPDQKFAIIDTVIDLPNVAGYIFAKDDSSYLGGIAAGMLTQTNKLGFVGAFDIPIIEKGLAGFVAGARSVDPDVEVMDGYVGSWSDIQGSKEMALSMSERGADVIYHNASLGGLGVIEASQSADFTVIGYDANQNELSPDTVALSVMRDMGKPVEHALLEMAEGRFPPRENELGVQEGAVFVSSEFSNIELGDAIWDKIHAAEEAIASGALKVPDQVEDIE